MAVARPQRRHLAETRPPIDDPLAVHRAFRGHRRRRLARIEHHREQQIAKRRFWFLLGALFLLAVFLGVTIWEQIQSVFGI